MVRLRHESKQHLCCLGHARLPHPCPRLRSGNCGTVHRDAPDDLAPVGGSNYSLVTSFATIGGDEQRGLSHTMCKGPLLFVTIPPPRMRRGKYLSVIHGLGRDAPVAPDYVTRTVAACIRSTRFHGQTKSERVEDGAHGLQPRIAFLGERRIEVLAV